MPPQVAQYLSHQPEVPLLVSASQTLSTALSTALMSSSSPTLPSIPTSVGLPLAFDGLTSLTPHTQGYQDAQVHTLDHHKVPATNSYILIAQKIQDVKSWSIILQGFVIGSFLCTQRSSTCLYRVTSSLRHRLQKSSPLLWIFCSSLGARTAVLMMRLCNVQ